MEAVVDTDARVLLRKALLRHLGTTAPGRCWVESSGGQCQAVKYFLDEVICLKDGGNWWCFSVVYVPAENSVGIWTRKMGDNVQSVLAGECTYQFDPATVDKWFDGWFEEAILEELTRP